MNDEPSSSSSGARANHDLDIPQEAAPTAAELAERRKKNRQMFNRKRGDLLDDLVRNLDILVYAELSTIYYMDCSFLRFLFRAFVQFMFLTLKQPPFPEQPGNRPVIAPLITSNLICLLVHFFSSAPEAGEATRGYLHGGLAMDFIGQKGPTSKVHLIILDMLVVALQLTHMAAMMARKRSRDAASIPTPPAVGSTPQPVSSAPPASVQQQDIESEERGVHRADLGTDIEMQTLNASGSAAPEPSATSDTLAATTAPRSDAHIFDAFNSGQIVLADLEIWKHIKEKWHMVKDMRVNAETSQSQASNLRAELAGRFLRLRIGTDALRQSIQ